MPETNIGPRTVRCPLCRRSMHLYRNTENTYYWNDSQAARATDGDQEWICACGVTVKISFPTARCKEEGRQSALEEFGVEL